MLPYRVLKMIRNRICTHYIIMIVNDGRPEIYYIWMFDCWIVIIMHSKWNQTYYNNID